MLARNRHGAREIRDCPADPDDTVTAAGAQTELLDCRLEHVCRPLVQAAMFSHFAAFHLPVEPLAGLAESRVLAFASLDDP